MTKIDATVADLVQILREFPQDLPISGSLHCVIDETEHLVYIEDERVPKLFNLMQDCPICSQYFVKREAPTIN